ncbi:MAG: phospholipase D family protein [Wenzhouxiangella sp.]|jgi:phosphatidylserine/phosphatidylglycerophosphate/cardiolipin synthase-like enzyme|nr:phospholipase D family protein [Wenzhouxiangella sp.]
MPGRFSNLTVSLARWLVAGFLVVTLGGCAVSAAKRAVADEWVLANAVQVVSPGGSDWPLAALPMIEGEGHRLILIDRGDDALAMRLHLIRTATESIEIQNYIFLLDDSGDMLLAELLAAARRGVRVRLLLDSLFSLPNEQLLADLELAHANLEVRLYRPLLGQAVVSDAEFIAAILCCFGGLNQRMHNKLMVVDGRHGLVGGRNYSARYFDLDTRMVFLDLEVLVTGPVTRQMVAGFDEFWAHSLSLPPRYTRRVHRRLFETERATPELNISPRLAALDAIFAEGRWLERLLARQSFRVGPVIYFSDLPEDRPRWRRPPPGDSTDVIHERIVEASDRVVIQTPYVVLSRAFGKLLSGLDPKVEIVISSNSLASTDAFPVYAISRKQRAFLLEELGVRLFEIQPYPEDLELFVPRYGKLIAERAAGIATPMRGDPKQPTRDMPGPRLSLHGKVVVIDGRYSIVTSHNLDPRSESWNTENGILVDDPAFAAAVLESIDRIIAPENSWVSIMNPESDGLLTAMNRAGSRLSRRLPTLDLWPGYRFQQYRQPAEPEVPVKSFDVSEATGVGLDPEVAAWQRRWITAWVSRMMGFLRPLM